MPHLTQSVRPGPLRHRRVSRLLDDMDGVGDEPEALPEEPHALVYDARHLLPVVPVERVEPRIIERGVVSVEDGEAGELRGVCGVSVGK